MPQESVLRPVLFILYINDILNLGDTLNVKLVSFADDTVILCTAHSWDDLKIIIEHVLIDVKIFLDTKNCF